jgi:hypothetical protein
VIAFDEGVPFARERGDRCGDVSEAGVQVAAGH